MVQNITKQTLYCDFDENKKKQKNKIRVTKYVTKMCYYLCNIIWIYFKLCVSMLDIQRYPSARNIVYDERIAQHVVIIIIIYMLIYQDHHPINLLQLHNKK